MKQARLAWAAFKTMMRMAVDDPLWAITALALAPFRAIRPIGQAIALLVLVTFIIGIGGSRLLEAIGFGKGSIPMMLMSVVFPILLIAMVFRLITTPMIHHFGNRNGDTHGSARFALSNETAPLTRNDSGLLIGRNSKTGKLFRYDGPAHLLTMAPTRTGKGVGTIIPNLLTANRSVICIDPKGENARITARARESFGPVYVLDPFGITDMRSVAFNPLDGLNPDGLDVAEDASTLADALVFDEPGMAGEAHWNEEAKALIAGLILRVITHEKHERRNLATLREYLTLPPEAFAALLKGMQDTDEGMA